MLSLMARLRLSIPLEPYPARSARHLPLEGKAMVRGGDILVSLPSPWGEKDLELLPPSSGRRCPEGAEVGSRSGMKGNVR